MRPHPHRSLTSDPQLSWTTSKFHNSRILRRPQSPSVRLVGDRLHRGRSGVPNGDPKELRALSKGLAHCGKRSFAMPAMDWAPVGATSKACYTPEVPQVLAQLDIVYTFANDLALQFDEFATACSDWAWDIEQAHRDIERIIANAVAAAVIVGVIAAVVNPRIRQRPQSSPESQAATAISSRRCAHHSRRCGIAAGRDCCSVGRSG